MVNSTIATILNRSSECVCILQCEKRTLCDKKNEMSMKIAQKSSECVCMLLLLLYVDNFFLLFRWMRYERELMCLSHCLLVGFTLHGALKNCSDSGLESQQRQQSNMSIWKDDNSWKQVTQKAHTQYIFATWESGKRACRAETHKHIHILMHIYQMYRRIEVFKAYCT